jgi:hypothetical protein
MKTAAAARCSTGTEHPLFLHSRIGRFCPKPNLIRRAIGRKWSPARAVFWSLQRSGRSRRIAGRSGYGEQDAQIGAAEAAAQAGFGQIFVAAKTV